MMVQKLKPWVTSFSEAIKKNSAHGDTVCVGGVITAIVDLSAILEDSKDEEGNPISEGVYLTLDDGVGINQIVVPAFAYKKYKDLYNIQKGMVVLAEGRVFQLEMKEKKRQLKNHIEATTRIACWKLAPLPESK